MGQDLINVIHESFGKFALAAALKDVQNRAADFAAVFEKEHGEYGNYDEPPCVLPQRGEPDAEIAGDTDDRVAMGGHECLHFLNGFMTPSTLRA